MGNIGDSGYTFKLCKSYSGSSGSYHKMYCVYPDDTSFYWSDAHGDQPRTKTCIFSFSWRSTGRLYSTTPQICEFVSKFDGKSYYIRMDATANRNTSWLWKLLAIGTIANLDYDLTPEVGQKEVVSIDIANSGGDGIFTIVLSESGVELDRKTGIAVNENTTIRETLSYLMLERVMNLTVDLIDEYNGNIVDTKQFVSIVDPCEGVSCAPVCVGDDRYTQVCDDGLCIRGTLIEANSIECGYVPPEPFVCNEGELRNGMSCSDGSVIYTEVCRNNAWVSTGESCPVEPEPEPDPEIPIEDDWTTYALVGIAAIIFVFLTQVK